MSREGEEPLAGRDSWCRPSRGYMRSSLEDLVWQTRAPLIGLGAEFPPDAPQGLSVQQIGDVDTVELRADPRLWVAYEHGWREHARTAPASPPAPTDHRPIPGPIHHTQRTVREATTAKPQPRPARQPPPARASQRPALASALTPVHRRPSQQQRRKPPTVQPRPQPSTAQPRAQPPTARPQTQPLTARPRTQPTAVQPRARPPSVPPRTQPPIQERQSETPVDTIPRGETPTVDEDACQAPPPAVVSHEYRDLTR
ncbi:transcriptional regulatory protein AlgP-like [Aphis gossypii]|uniref:transcriptional regulatory protein AlgP-like n=1 Tax=Aphis gossypii TaxID=80765 RepID=UPI0021597894|nr:transcriptional regulatory protein AlgP-like [Aphis gossypii]